MKYPIEVKLNIENTYDRLTGANRITNKKIVLIFGLTIFRKEIITIKYR